MLARNLGREKEKIDVISLNELNSEKVDMLTVVLIGSTQTQLMKLNSGQTYVYTPRGYGNKKEKF